MCGKLSCSDCQLPLFFRSSLGISWERWRTILLGRVVHDDISDESHGLFVGEPLEDASTLPGMKHGRGRSRADKVNNLVSLWRAVLLGIRALDILKGCV